MKKSSPKSEQTKAKAVPRVNRDDPEQSKLFIQKAKELGADEPSAANVLMGRLAKTLPDPKPARKPKAAKGKG